MDPEDLRELIGAYHKCVASPGDLSERFGNQDPVVELQCEGSAASPYLKRCLALSPLGLAKLETS